MFYLVASSTWCSHAYTLAIHVRKDYTVDRWAYRLSTHSLNIQSVDRQAYFRIHINSIEWKLLSSNFEDWWKQLFSISKTLKFPNTRIKNSSAVLFRFQCSKKIMIMLRKRHILVCTKKLHEGIRITSWHMVMESLQLAYKIISAQMGPIGGITTWKHPSEKTFIFKLHIENAIMWLNYSNIKFFINMLIEIKFHIFAMHLLLILHTFMSWTGR